MEVHNLLPSLVDISWAREYFLAISKAFYFVTVHFVARGHSDFSFEVSSGEEVVHRGLAAEVEGGETTGREARGWPGEATPIEWCADETSDEGGAAHTGKGELKFCGSFMDVGVPHEVKSEVWHFGWEGQAIGGAEAQEGCLGTGSQVFEAWNFLRLGHGAADAFTSGTGNSFCIKRLGRLDLVNVCVCLVEVWRFD